MYIQQDEKSEMINLEADKKYIRSEIMYEQPNGNLCKYSQILKCVCTYNMPKEQYIRYWSGRYKNKLRDQQEIIDCCYDMFKTGLVSVKEMINLVNKSKDRKSEKEEIIKCLTQRVYFNINNDEEEDI